MSRRANHEGNVRERSDGRREASITYNGRRYYRRGRTRAEAVRLLNDLKADHATGDLVQPARVTVGEHLGDWVEANTGAWRPSTRVGYEGIIRNYLVPAFGAKRLQALTAADIARQYGRWRRDGVGARTLAIIHARLHRALKQAVYWGRIPRNPADNVEPPRSEYRKPSLWTPEQASRFVGALTGERWDHGLWAMALGGGLRLGEACSITWPDIDFAAGTVHVARTRTIIERAWVEGAPKTRAATHTLRLPGFALAVLRDWKRTQAIDRLATGPEWAGADRVVTMQGGGSPRSSQAGSVLRRLCREYGLPELRPHDLRHISASLALGAGVPLTDVSRRLGHANVSITATIYAHALGAGDGHIADALERALRVG